MISNKKACWNKQINRYSTSTTRINFHCFFFLFEKNQHLIQKEMRIPFYQLFCKHQQLYDNIKFPRLATTFSIFIFSGNRQTQLIFDASYESNDFRNFSKQCRRCLQRCRLSSNELNAFAKVCFNACGEQLFTCKKSIFQNTMIWYPQIKNIAQHL